jgi:hypothetical protein
MRNPKGKRHEEQMYRAVKTFLEKDCGCTPVVADLPEDRPKIHLPRNLNMRDPDVVGVTETGEVYIAEGKCLRSGEAFDQCVAQAQSLSAFAEYLYVFFPSEEWSRLRHNEDERNKKLLRQKGIGLLLVDEADNCEVLLRPDKNKDVDTSKKNELRRGLGLPVRETLPNPGHLSSKSASTAVEILDCFSSRAMKAATEAILSVFNRNGSLFSFEVYHPVEDPPSPPVAVWSACLGEDDGIYLELDVFGGYLRDGHSCIWVGRVIGQQALRRHLETGVSGPGTHVFFNRTGEMHSWNDITIDALPKHPTEDMDTYWVVHRVDVFGRPRHGLRRELEKLLLAAKKLK